MSKEQIIKGFSNLIKRVEGDLECIDTFIGTTKEDIRIKKYQDFVSKVYDQVRQETIKEIIKDLREINRTNDDISSYGDGFEDAVTISIANILNKLKQ